MQYLDINTMPGHPGSDPAVRNALRLGLDRREIVRTVDRGFGRASDDFFPTAHPMHWATRFTRFDLARARQVLVRAGWRLGADTVRTRGSQSLTLVAVIPTGTPDIDQMFELFRANLRALGIELTIRHYPASLVFGSLSGGGILANGRFDLTAVAQTLDTLGDLSVNFGCDQRPPSGYNFGRFCDARLDDAFARFNATYSGLQRRPIARAIQRRLNEELPAIVTASADDLFASNSDIRGFAPNQSTFFDSFMNVDI